MNTTEETTTAASDLVMLEDEATRDRDYRDLLVRTSPKQSWQQARTVELKHMTADRVQAWCDGMNELEGWSKYGVATF